MAFFKKDEVNCYDEEFYEKRNLLLVRHSELCAQAKRVILAVNTILFYIGVEQQIAKENAEIEKEMLSAKISLFEKARKDYNEYLKETREVRKETLYLNSWFDTGHDVVSSEYERFIKKGF